MPITFSCHDCGQIFKVETDKAGRKGPCSNCGEDLIVPCKSQGHAVKALAGKNRRDASIIRTKSPEPLSPPLDIPKVESPLAEEKVQRDTVRHFGIKTLLMATAVVAAVLTLFGTLWKPGFPFAVTHYGAMGFLAWVFLRWAKRQTSSPIRFGVAAVAVAAIVALWGSYDHSSEVWHNNKDGFERMYVDYRTRWAGRLYYRELYISPDLKVFPNEDNFLWIQRGGLTESRKKHGYWGCTVQSISNPTGSTWEGMGYKFDRAGIMGRKNVWFWYGEEITEGEWVLRNR